jgi:two-component system CheB/CheR fusion protein
MGRPIIDMSQENLGRDLIADAKSVLDRLSPITRRWQSTAPGIFAPHCAHRTSDNRIEGVVITYSDVHEIKRAEAHKTSCIFPSVESESRY